MSERNDDPLSGGEPVEPPDGVFAASPDKSPAVSDPVGTDPYATEAVPQPAGAQRVPPPRGRFWQTFSRELYADNNFTVTLLAIVLALVFGGILMIIGDADTRKEWSYLFYQPLETLGTSLAFVGDAYGSMFRGAIFDPDTVNRALWGLKPWQEALRPISETLTYAAPLIFTGLAVAVPFRAGLFNIGGQGQAILGALAGGTVGLTISLPWPVHLPLAVLAGAVAGGLSGLLVGVLKARTGAHEVIVTIMLNYISFLFLGWFILQQGIKNPNRPDAISSPVNDSAMLPQLVEHGLLRANWGFLLAVLAAAGVAWLLKRGTFGFELRAVGHNPHAARSAGIKVGATLAITMALAGALAGLGGTTMVLGTAQALTVDVVGQIGFNGILVALLGRVRPWGVVLAGLLFGALQAGGNAMQTFSGVSVELVTVIQAMIVIFVAAPLLVRSIFLLRRSPSAAAQAGLAKG